MQTKNFLQFVSSYFPLCLLILKVQSALSTIVRKIEGTVVDDKYNPGTTQLMEALEDYDNYNYNESTEPTQKLSLPKMTSTDVYNMQHHGRKVQVPISKDKTIHKKLYIQHRSKLMKRLSKKALHLAQESNDREMMSVDEVNRQFNLHQKRKFYDGMKRAWLFLFALVMIIGLSLGFR